MNKKYGVDTFDRRCSYSDSNTDSDSDEEEFTVINRQGVTTEIFQNGEVCVNNGSLINSPGLRNIQVGNGRIAIISGAVGTSRSPSLKNKNQLHKCRTVTSTDSMKSLTALQSPPSLNDLNHICNNIGKSWKKMALALGFSRGAIETIEIDNSLEGVYEMAWQTILKWRRKRVDDVKLCYIARILDDIGMVQLARELPVDQ